ncbi:MAG: D-alanyl-D-alanine carboxypeptidase/D-alanyl-D-alanine-endopeptidase [Bacteroidales bacterium]|nr:D-alanyl-D-alanine carboxypeptidase/D-alanyl-D-alanine-endopeptidase [Bacteroidales bacterium]
MRSHTAIFRLFQAALLVLIVNLQIPFCSAQNTSKLDQTVRDVQNSSQLSHATLSVCVYNVTKNKSVYSYEAQRSLVPASMMKILTTAVGFERLGSTFRFKTVLKHTGKIDRNGVLHGDIVIVGGGDPILGSYRYKQTTPDSLFTSWMKALKNNGIRSIDGRICYDASFFDDKQHNDSWQWGDIGNYYGCGASGLNFHENMFFVYFNGGQKVGQAATVDHTSPNGIKVHAQNFVTTGPANSGDNVIIYGDATSSIRIYDGTVPLGKRNFSVRGALPNPAESCASLFTAFLKSNGINVSGTPTQNLRHADGKDLMDYLSNTYYVIAQYTNLTSNNLYAESIFKYLGYKMYKKGTSENGSKAILAYCTESGLNIDGVKLKDGCGLSRENRLTCDFMCRFLRHVARRPIYSDFSKTLAKVGESGTAKNMLPKLPANVAMKIKSGSMDGVKSYAGYITTAKGELLCFSIIANNFTCSPSQVQAQLEKIMMQMATMQ